MKLYKIITSILDFDGDVEDIKMSELYSGMTLFVVYTRLCHHAYAMSAFNVKQFLEFVDSVTKNDKNKIAALFVDNIINFVTKGIFYYDQNEQQALVEKFEKVIDMPVNDQQKIIDMIKSNLVKDWNKQSITNVIDFKNPLSVIKNEYPSLLENMPANIISKLESGILQYYAPYFYVAAKGVDSMLNEYRIELSVDRVKKELKERIMFYYNDLIKSLGLKSTKNATSSLVDVPVEIFTEIYMLKKHNTTEQKHEDTDMLKNLVDGIFFNL